MFTLLIFLTCSSLALADLRCYSCHPSGAGSCQDPENDNIENVSCDQKIFNSKDLKAEDRRGLEKIQIQTVKGLPGKDNISYKCVALYFVPHNKSDKSPEGVYRDCARITDPSKDPCQQITEKFQNLGSVTACKFCNTDNCNEVAIGSAATLTISAILSICTLVIFLN